MNKPLAAFTAIAVAGLISAGPASAASPSLTTDTIDEGESLVLPVSHTCGVKKCLYAAEIVDGTAAAGSDYTAVPATYAKRKKYKPFATTVTVQSVDDQVCEPSEALTLRVTLVRKGTAATFDATETILDNDCDNTPAPSAPAPAPPAPAPAPPAQTDPNAPPFPITNPEGSFMSTTVNTGRSTQECTTPAFTDTSSQCIVYVRCPQTATTGCRTFASETVSASQNPHRVTGYLLVGPFLGSWIDQFQASCQDFGQCTATADGVTRTKPGEFFVAACDARHDPNILPPDQDRFPDPKAVINCKATVYYP